MPHYVDGFLLAVPKDKVEAYRKLAQDASVVWKEHGAIAYFEGLADDVQPGKLTSFPQAVQLKDDEVVIFSWVVYRSREQRDEVNAKVMADPRIANLDPKTMPFDAERMIFGGFSSLVEA